MSQTAISSYQKSWSFLQAAGEQACTHWYSVTDQVQRHFIFFKCIFLKGKREISTDKFMGEGLGICSWIYWMFEQCVVLIWRALTHAVVVCRTTGWRQRTKHSVWWCERTMTTNAYKSLKLPLMLQERTK